MRSNQKGAAVLVVILIVVAVGLIGFAGWQVSKRQAQTASQPAAGSTTQATAPEVKSSQDLNEAERYLNTSDIDQELDTSELDAALSE